MKSSSSSALLSIVVPTAIVTAMCALIAAFLAGGAGAIGALLGGLVVVLFLGSTPVVLEPLVAASPQLSLGVAVAFFGTKTVAATIALLLLFDVGGVADHVDAASFGLTAALVSVVWTLLQIVAYRKHRVPTYDLGNRE